MRGTIQHVGALLALSGSMLSTVVDAQSPAARAELRRAALSERAARVAVAPIEPAITRDALVVIADEYVAEQMPLLADVRQGMIMPGCKVDYPNLEVLVGQQGIGPSAQRSAAIRVAIDSAIIKRNLIALGIAPDQAAAWTDQYYNGVMGPSPTQRAIRTVQIQRVPVAARRVDQQPVTSPAARRAREIAPISDLARESQRVAGSPSKPETPEQKLVQTVNDYDAKPAGFPTVRGRGDCYMSAPLAFSTPYRLRPLPVQSGRVFVLPRFSFRLCELQKVDPYDRTRCDNWVDVSGQPARLTGRYVVSAEWSDGRSNRSTRDFVYIDRNEHVIDIFPDR